MLSECAVLGQEIKKNVRILETLSVNSLEYLLNCSSSFHFNELGAFYKGFESKKFLRKAVNEMKRLLMKYQDVNDILEKLTHFFNDGYKREWFENETLFYACKERDLKRLQRMVSYINDNNYKIDFVDFPCKIQLNDGLEFKGYKILEISSKVDLILSKGNERIAVNIEIGKPRYSYKAKKERNKVKNAISLLATYLGTSYRFGGNAHLSVANWYLVNKDDKGFDVVDQFDNGTGKNIISTDFSGNSLQEIKQLFMNVLNLPEELDKCESCIHSSLCQMKKEVRSDSKDLNTLPGKKGISKKNEPKITEAQQIVINHEKGPMSVIAVPGAGKTFTLVERLVKLIDSGIEPQSILFVTFTNKAAKEIEERVSKRLLSKSENIKLPMISTFNGFGFNILKSNPMYLGGRVKLATEVDRLALIMKILEFTPTIKGVSYDGLYTEYGLLRQLDKLFIQIDEDGEEVFIEKYADKKDTENILIAYHMYKEKYKAAGYINYDEQISLVNTIFNKYPVLSKRYANQFQYIMIDEFQDTSHDQAEMIYSIARHHNNILVVGDDDQSIYRWRNGSSKYILNFEKDFVGARVVFMNDNFRSNNRILNASGDLIKQNIKRYHKNFIPHKEADYKPIYFKGLGAFNIPSLIKQVLSKGYLPGDIAILARDNKRLSEVYQVLNGVVPVANPKEFIINDTVFLGINDVLSLYYNGLEDDESFYRFMGYNNHENLLYKSNKAISFYNNLLNDDVLINIDKDDVNCLSKYEYKINESILMREGHRLISCFKSVQYAKSIEEGMEKILYLLFGLDKHPVVTHLIDAAADRGIVSIKELFQLMKNMILYKTDDKIDYSDFCRDRVNLLTAHSSKGKEFKVVIIYATEDFKAEDDEIKLLYVAMTRAQNSLFMIESPYNQCDLLTCMSESLMIKE